jgi:hypothetical protein
MQRKGWETLYAAYVKGKGGRVEELHSGGV